MLLRSGLRSVKVCVTLQLKYLRDAGGVVKHEFSKRHLGGFILIGQKTVRKERATFCLGKVPISLCLICPTTWLTSFGCFHNQTKCFQFERKPDESSGVLPAEAEVAEEQGLGGIRFDVLAGLGTQSFVELELDDEADEVPTSTKRILQKLVQHYLEGD